MAFVVFRLGTGHGEPVLAPVDVAHLRRVSESAVGWCGLFANIFEVYRLDEYLLFK